jgi:hypothetical protein
MGLDNAYGIGSLKSGVCTSTTRPASPYEGQVIYETDTDLLKSYNGSSWVTMGPASAPVVDALSSATVATSQTTTSGTYTDLTTAGPSVTVTTTTKALVILTAYLTGSVGAEEYFMSFAVSGATTISAADTKALRVDISTANEGTQMSAVYPVTITAGSNTFTAKYRRGGPAGTLTASDRSITVVSYA